MGLLGMMQPNPYIDPSYPDKPLKLPGFYTGQSGGNMPPTDAYGKPIQSFVDANAAKAGGLSGPAPRPSTKPDAAARNDNAEYAGRQPMKRPIRSCRGAFTGAAQAAGGYNLPMAQHNAPELSSRARTEGGNQSRERRRRQPPPGWGVQPRSNSYECHECGPRHARRCAGPAPPTPPDTRRTISTRWTPGRR